MKVWNLMYPNKPKCWSLERRKVDCKAKSGEWVMLKTRKLPDGFEGDVSTGKIWSEGCRVCDFLDWLALQMVTAAMKWKMLAPWKKTYDQPKQHIKMQRHYFVNKGTSSQSCGFSSSHVWMWELDYKESWVLKNWCFWTLWCWRTLLRVPWTARRSNQSILKEISP